LANVPAVDLQDRSNVSQFPQARKAPERAAARLYWVSAETVARPQRATRAMAQERTAVLNRESWPDFAGGCGS
jgi:hypothetical protein